MKTQIKEIYENKDSLKQLILQIDASGDTSLSGQMIYALGAYFNILYKENIGQEVFPSSLLPLKKASIRYWMHEYYKTVFYKKRKILQYQEIGVTNLSKFQDMSQEEWDIIKNMNEVQLIKKINYFKSNNSMDTSSLDNIDTIIYTRSIEESIEKDMLYDELKSIPKKKKYIPILIAALCIIITMYIIFN